VADFSSLDVHKTDRRVFQEEGSLVKNVAFGDPGKIHNPGRFYPFYDILGEISAVRAIVLSDNI
jgi:hypothetical protein